VVHTCLVVGGCGGCCVERGMVEFRHCYWTQNQLPSGSYISIHVSPAIPDASRP